MAKKATYIPQSEADDDSIYIKVSKIADKMDLFEKSNKDLKNKLSIQAQELKELKVKNTKLKGVVAHVSSIVPAKDKFKVSFKGNNHPYFEELRKYFFENFRNNPTPRLPKEIILRKREWTNPRMLQLIASIWGQQFLNQDFFTKATLRKVLEAAGLHCKIVRQDFFNEYGDNCYTNAYPIHKKEEEEWYS
jgi:regulator of replication initiation timing